MLLLLLMLVVPMMKMQDETNECLRINTRVAFQASARST
jgi:hypothetical protein